MCTENQSMITGGPGWQFAQFSSSQGQVNLSTCLDLQVVHQAETCLSSLFPEVFSMGELVVGSAY